MFPSGDRMVNRHFGTSAIEDRMWTLQLRATDDPVRHSVDVDSSEPGTLALPPGSLSRNVNIS